MDNKVNYASVGLFVVLLGALALTLVLWLSSLRHDKTYETYATYMREDVSGLNVQAPVRYSGVAVGYVSLVRLNPHDPQQVEILMKIEEGTPILTSTRATLTSEGITGVYAIGLKTSTEAPPLRATSAHRYPVILAEPSLLVKVNSTIQEATVAIAQLNQSVHELLSPANQQSIHDTLVNVAKITGAVAANRQVIAASLRSTQRILDHTAVASTELPSMMQSAQQMMARLDAMSIELQRLSEDLERNPAMLVRGKAPQPLGPGEDR